MMNQNIIDNQNMKNNPNIMNNQNLMINQNNNSMVKIDPLPYIKEHKKLIKFK